MYVYLRVGPPLRRQQQTDVRSDQEPIGSFRMSGECASGSQHCNCACFCLPSTCMLQAKAILQHTWGRTERRETSSSCVAAHAIGQCCYLSKGQNMLLIGRRAWLLPCSSPCHAFALGVMKVSSMHHNSADRGSTEYLEGTSLVCKGCIDRFEMIQTSIQHAQQSKASGSC